MKKRSLKSIVPHLPFLIILVALSFAFFMPFLQGKLSFVWDTRVFGFTYLHEVTKAISSGHFPLWDQFNFSGNPFMGDIESGMFYPVNWLFAWVFGAMKFAQLPYYFVAHFIIGSFCAYGLSHHITKNRFASLVGAVTFAFSGYALGHISHLGQITMYMWIPAVIWAFLVLFEKKEWFYAALAGLTFGVATLVGHYNTSIYLLLAITLLFIFSLITSKTSAERLKSLYLFITSGIITFLIAAILVLPVIELAFQSNRTELSYQQQSKEWSLNPLDLKGMALPNAHGILDEQPLANFSGSVDITQNYLYIGFLSLFLIAISLISDNKYKWYFIGLGTLAAFAAFGEHTYVNLILFKTFPGFGKARMAVQIMCLFFLSASVLAAIGTNQLLKSFKNKYIALLFAAAIPLLITTDIFYHGFNKSFYSEAIPPTAVYETEQELALIDSIVQDQPTERVLDETGALYLNKWRYYEIRNVWGASGIRIKKYDDLFTMANFPAKKPLTVSLINFLNTNLIITDESLPYPNFTKKEINNRNAYINPKELPRAFFVTEYLIESSPENALQLIREDEVDFTKQVLLQKEPTYLGQTPDQLPTETTITWHKQEPNLLELTATTTIQRILVLSEVDYTGWKLYVDGERKEYLNANYAFRAVPLQPGTHKIEFRYSPNSFFLGGSLSVIGLLLFLAFACFKAFRIFRS